MDTKLGCTHPLIVVENTMEPSSSSVNCNVASRCNPKQCIENEENGDVIHEDLQQHTMMGPSEGGVVETEGSVTTNCLHDTMRRCGVFFKKIGFLIVALFNIADIFTDLWLVWQYAFKKQYWYCGLTAMFIWLPSFMSTYILYQICKREEKHSWMYKYFVKWKWPLFITFTFQISSTVFALRHALVSKHLSEREFEENQKRLSQLQLIDGFAEAAPQATLQTYIWSNNRLFSRCQLLSILFSYCTIARVATSHSYNIGTFDGNTKFIQATRSPIYKYVINMWIIMSRIPLISIAFLLSPKVTLYCIVIHYILCCIGLGYLKCKLPDRLLLTHLFTFPNVSLYNVFINIDMSVFRVHLISKLRMYMLYYVLFIIEQIIFTCICIYYNRSNQELVMCSIVCGICGLFFTIVTYVHYQCRKRKQSVRRMKSEVPLNILLIE